MMMNEERVQRVMHALLHTGAGLVVIIPMPEEGREEEPVGAMVAGHEDIGQAESARLLRKLADEIDHRLNARLN